MPGFGWGTAEQHGPLAHSVSVPLQAPAEAAETTLRAMEDAALTGRCWVPLFTVCRISMCYFCSGPHATRTWSELEPVVLGKCLGSLSEASRSFVLTCTQYNLRFWYFAKRFLERKLDSHFVTFFWPL